MTIHLTYNNMEYFLLITNLLTFFFLIIQGKKNVKLQKEYDEIMERYKGVLISYSEEKTKNELLTDKLFVDKVLKFHDE